MICWAEPFVNASSKVLLAISAVSLDWPVQAPANYVRSVLLQHIHALHRSEQAVQDTPVAEGYNTPSEVSGHTSSGWSSSSKGSASSVESNDGEATSSSPYVYVDSDP